MNNNEKYAVKIMWLKKYLTANVIILWSDHTWEEVCISQHHGCYEMQGRINMRHIVDKKLSRTDSLKYIEEQIRELGL